MQNDACGNMSYSSYVSHRSYSFNATSKPCAGPALHRSLRRALPLAFVILCFVIRHSALAHPADQSELRVRPQPHQLELRFTFNILTLTRFTGIDTDGDAKISMAELAAAQPRIATYLNEHIHVEINQQKSTLGSGLRFEPLWPNADQTPAMSEPDYAARNVDVTFVQTIAGKVLEDFWLGFEIFEQTGPMQTIRGVFEQDGRIEEVPFSVQEPEYLYDTGFANDPFVQEAEKKIQASLSAPPTEDLPMQPSATLAAAPTPAANGTVSLATPIDTTPAAPSTERWWMIRAVVVMIMLVVGRQMQLSAHAHLKSPRRRIRPR